MRPAPAPSHGENRPATTAQPARHRAAARCRPPPRRRAAAPAPACSARPDAQLQGCAVQAGKDERRLTYWPGVSINEMLNTWLDGRCCSESWTQAQAIARLSARIIRPAVRKAFGAAPPRRHAWISDRHAIV